MDYVEFHFLSRHELVKVLRIAELSDETGISRKTDPERLLKQPLNGQSIHTQWEQIEIKVNGYHIRYLIP